MTTAQKGGPPSRWWYWAGVGLMLAAGLYFTSLWMPAMERKVARFPRVVMPGTEVVELRTGEYELFHESRSVVDGHAYRGRTPMGLSCEFVSVVGRRKLRTWSSAGTTNYAFGHFKGRVVGEFTVDVAGSYELSCDADDDEPFVIAMGQGMQRQILWGGIPMLLGTFGGIIFMIVLWRWRKRALARLKVPPVTAFD